MQMAWERLALICAILLPPGCLLVPVSLILKNCVNTY
jgi:cytochrome c oxidase subunit IV